MGDRSLDMADTGVGGSEALCSLWAVWRNVIAFRRSPPASSNIRCSTSHISHDALDSESEAATDSILHGHILRSSNHLYPRLTRPLRQRLETKLGAARSDRLNDARDIVAHETEARDARISLHDSAQGRLGVLRHGVGFVEDDEFVRWTGVRFAVSTLMSTQSDEKEERGGLTMMCRRAAGFHEQRF